MSSDFSKVKVIDDRLNVSDQVKYAVHKGGQNMTSAQFNAISQTTSSHTYNIQIPSEQTICDRRVLWQSTVVLSVVGTAPVGKFLIDYGLADALGPFPLHQLVSVMTATINNNSVSINTRDVLSAMLRFNDKRELQRYNGYTPVAYDTYQKYSDALGANNNPNGSWVNTADNDLSPRGSWVLDAISTDPTFPGTPASVPVVSTGASQTVYVKFTVSEPLMLSPFIFAHPKSNNQGFYGIQNMNFVFNIGDASRVWRSANAYSQVCSVVSFTNSRLIFNFLTPHPSDLMPSRNVVGYYEMPRFITANNPAFGAYGSSTYRQVIRTSNIQLNQIPDKLILFCRQSIGTLTVRDSDSFLAIEKLSINFNNQSGILASATQQDLYRYSVENGCNSSWPEFSGSANQHNVAVSGGNRVPTSGSVVVLEFGKDIQLVEDYYAPGSLGNFSLQIQADVANQSASAISSTEFVIITMNSGVFVNERGTSSTFTGILTKSDVLDVSTQEPYSRSDVARMVGGGFLDSLKSVAGKVLPKLASLAKPVLAGMDNKYAKAGAEALGSLGYGRSGGGTSGGGGSGGRHKLDGRLQ